MALNRYPVPSSEALLAQMRDVDGRAGWHGRAAGQRLGRDHQHAVAGRRTPRRQGAGAGARLRHVCRCRRSSPSWNSSACRCEPISRWTARRCWPPWPSTSRAIIYLAYPNNPTGNLFDAADMEAIVRAAQGEVCQSLVVVDEAYQPFAQESWMPRLTRIRQSAGDAHGVEAAAWPGSASATWPARLEWLAQLDKVRPPYNVNVLTEATAMFALEHVDVLDEQAAQLRAERSRLVEAMVALPGVTVFPSAANFLLIRVADAAQTFGPTARRGRF